MEISHPLQEARIQVFFIHDVEECPAHVKVGHHNGGAHLFTTGQGHPGGFAVAHNDLLDLGLFADFAAKGLQRTGDGIADPTHAAPGEAPGADVAVDLTHVVMQQHVGTSGRVWPKGRADDAAAGQGGLDHVTFEKLVQVIADAHGPESQGVVNGLLVHFQHPASNGEQFLDVPVAKRGRVGRGSQQEIPDKPGLAHGFRGKSLVRIRVVARMPGHLPVGHLVIPVAAQVVAVAHERDAAAVGGDLQPVTGQVQGLEDLRPQQAANIGTIGVDPVLVQFPADRRAADVVVLFQHHHFQAGLGQKSGVGQAIVACPDDNGVVAVQDNRSPGTQRIFAVPDQFENRSAPGSVMIDSRSIQAAMC